MVEIQHIECKNQQKLSSYCRNIVPYKQKSTSKVFLANFPCLPIALVLFLFTASALIED